MNALSRAADAVKRALLRDEVVERIDETKARLADLEHYTAHLQTNHAEANRAEAHQSKDDDGTPTH